MYRVRRSVSLVKREQLQQGKANKESGIRRWLRQVDELPPHRDRGRFTKYPLARSFGLYHNSDAH